MMFSLSIASILFTPDLRAFARKKLRESRISDVQSNPLYGTYFLLRVFLLAFLLQGIFSEITDTTPQKSNGRPLKKMDAM